MSDRDRRRKRICVWKYVRARVLCVLSQYRNKMVTLKTGSPYRAKKGTFPDTCKQARKIAK